MFRLSSILFCTLLLLAACNEMVAERLVEAPNRKSAVRGQDSPQQVLDQDHVFRQLRVDVGPPAASLSVWVINPIAGPGFFRLKDGDSSQMNVLLTFGSETGPTIDPSAAELPRGTVFILHGYGDDKEEVPYQFYALATAAEGYRVVLVDLRGHGRSTGDRVTYGATESRDMVQTLDALQRQGLIAGNVGAAGVSYGAAVALCWAGIDPRVRAVVALEPFSTLHEAAADAGPLLLSSLAWLYSSRDYQAIATRVGELGGFDPDRDSPLAGIRRTNAPVLIIHGQSDICFGPGESIRLHEAAENHSRLILVNGASHLDLWIKAAPTILRESNEWLGRYLTDESPPAVALTGTATVYPSTRPDYGRAQDPGNGGAPVAR
jgi:pimeloyl-ACP methyl ester carboxylesterase